MLNGWDILGLIIFSIMICIIVNKLALSSCVKKAINKANKLDCTDDKVFDYVDKEIAKAFKIIEQTIDNRMESKIANMSESKEDGKNERR